ncbi:MAG TPA: hypothetical protein VMP11_18615 [Verrucomicrobiae bacterium]|nr:hypothetical protein [Verrucomicrobiae bacterium]
MEVERTGDEKKFGLTDETFTAATRRLGHEPRVIYREGHQDVFTRAEYVDDDVFCQLAEKNPSIIVIAYKFEGVDRHHTIAAVGSVTIDPMEGLVKQKPVSRILRDKTVCGAYVFESLPLAAAKACVDQEAGDEQRFPPAEFFRSLT